MNMSPKAKKILKIVLWSLAGVVGFIILALLTIPLWIGPVVTGVANSKVPEMTKTGFHMGEFGLNPYTGRLHIGDVQLQNPTNYFVQEAMEEAKEGESLADMGLRSMRNFAKGTRNWVFSPETNAVTFTSIDVSLQTTSLLSDTVRIEEVVVKDLYIYGTPTFANIREIVANVTAPKAEEAEAADAPKSAEEVESKPAPAEEAAAEGAEKSGRKFVIDRVILTGTKVKYGDIEIALDDITIPDIGKDDPAAEEALYDIVVDWVCDALDKKVFGVGSVLKLAYYGGKSIGRGLKTVKEVSGEIAEVLMKMGGSILGSSSDSGTGASAAGAVTDSIKGLFGGSK